MNVVIPYTLPLRDSSGLELRYSLRSLEKHFRPGIDRCIIVGYPPQWYTGSRIPFDDVPGRKELSLIQKVMRACMEQRDPFLYTNDDFFALQDFDDRLPAFYDKLCCETATRQKDPRYRKMFARCPKQWKNFDIHVPMIIEPGHFLSALSNFPRLLMEDYPIKSTYANTCGIEGVKLMDTKIRGKRPRTWIVDQLRGKPFFSTHDNALGPDLLEILEELYPKKSIFER